LACSIRDFTDCPLTIIDETTIELNKNGNSAHNYPLISIDSSINIEQCQTFIDKQNHLLTITARPPIFIECIHSRYRYNVNHGHCILLFIFHRLPIESIRISHATPAARRKSMLSPAAASLLHVAKHGVEADSEMLARTPRFSDVVIAVHMKKFMNIK
jgi:hypothetical protein